MTSHLSIGILNSSLSSMLPPYGALIVYSKAIGNSPRAKIEDRICFNETGDVFNISIVDVWGPTSTTVVTILINLAVTWLFYIFDKSQKIGEIEKKLNPGSKKIGCDLWPTNWFNCYSTAKIYIFVNSEPNWVFKTGKWFVVQYKLNALYSLII